MSFSASARTVWVFKGKRFCKLNSWQIQRKEERGGRAGRGESGWKGNEGSMSRVGNNKTWRRAVSRCWPCVQRVMAVKYTYTEPLLFSHTHCWTKHSTGLPGHVHVCPFACVYCEYVYGPHEWRCIQSEIEEVLNSCISTGTLLNYLPSFAHAFILKHSHTQTLPDTRMHARCTHAHTPPLEQGHSPLKLNPTWTQRQHKQTQHVCALIFVLTQLHTQHQTSA